MHGDDGRITPTKDRPPLELSPLPPAPVIDVPHGALPGIPAGPLAVIVFRPERTLRGRERPALTFNKPVVPLGADDDELPEPATITPPVAGRWRWIGSAAAEFLPDQPFPWASRFVVTVKPDLKALDGEGMAAPVSFQFETLAPSVENTKPENNWPWLDADKPLSITFNQPVKGLENAKLLVRDRPARFRISATVDVDAEAAKKAGRRPQGRTPWGQPTRYELTLLDRLPAESAVRLDLAGVTGVEGPAAVEEARLAWRTRGPMRVLRARLCGDWANRCPQGPLVLQTTNQLDVESLKGRLHMKAKSGPHVGKEVDLDVDGAWQRPEIDGEPRWITTIDASLQPGTVYEVVVDAGAVDDRGQKAPAFAATVTTSDLEPWLNVSGPFVLLEKSGDGALPIESANVDSVEATVMPLSISDMARLLADERRAPTGEAIRRSVPIQGRKNTFVRTPLPLRDVLPAGAPQLFVVDAWSEQTKETSYKQRAIGQITDLAAHAKLGATSGLVWVTSLSTGTPVAGAVVAVWDGAGDKRHEAVTDADGIARLPGAIDMLGKDGDSDDTWFVPYALVSATKDGDTGVTLSSWEGELGPRAARAWDGDVPEVNVVVFAERGIYRPGEEVYVKGVVRSRVRGALALPKADSELRLTLVDDDGTKVKDERVALSRFGTFSTTATLPKDARLGWWNVRVAGKLMGRDVSGGTSFRVEQYRAPQFKVDLVGPVGPRVSGDALQTVVNARTLFGAPMPGATVEATVVRTTLDFAPEGNDGFAFGVRTWWWDDDEPRPSSDVYARTHGTIGADGTFFVDVGAVEATAGRTWTYTVEAEVKDVSRQAVAARTSVVVHPAALYAGVKVDGGFGEVGKPAPLSVIAVDLDGKRVAGRAIDVVIKRRDWKNVRKRDEDLGRFVLHSEPVDSDVGRCDDVRSADAPVPCAFTPEKPGLHIVEATVTDDQGRTQRTRASFYVVGSGWVSWQRSEDDQLELVADKSGAYEPGETAKVLIKSPWPQAEALVTVEREGIRSVRRVTLTGSATAVDVPIDEAAIPNVFVGVVMVRGRVADDVAAKEAAASGRKGEVDPGRPQVKVGTLHLAVQKTKKRLDVAIDTGGGTKRPGEKLTLKLKVTDAGKRGVPAEVTLWAVDEAVLRLTDYTPPDLLAAFHPMRGLSVRFGEPLIHLVKKQAYGGKGEPGGGGGGDDAGSGFRSNFKTTALFAPDIVTDDSGNATVDVTLPDDLTTYRLMAVAISGDDRFGRGQSEIVVQKPVMALPALPRFARVGDRFEAGVVVHSAEPGDVVVSALPDASGAVSLQGDASRTITLRDRGVEVRFPFRAEKPGRAELRFKAVRGKESDGVAIGVPITLPVVLETTAVSGMTDGERQEALQPPGAARSDVGGLEVSLSSTALAGAQEAMRQLVEYPHGCAEQLASKLVPFLALRELQAGFGEVHQQGSDRAIADAVAWLGPQILDEKGNAQPDRVVGETLEKLLALQESDGGFRVWPKSACVDPSASAWATLALHRARELGYAVDAKDEVRAIAFLRDRVLADDLPPCSWGRRRATTSERIMAGFVLSRVGQPRLAPLQPIVTDVLKKPDASPLFARALLADALVLGKGDAASVQKVLQTVLNTARETPREVHFEEPDGARFASPWSSDVRTSAIVLMTLVDAVPEHPFVPKLVRYLENARTAEGRYRNTQEAAFALMAMTELVRAKERSAPDFDAIVTLGGTPLLTEDFQGRSLGVVKKLVPMAEVLAKGSGELPFVFAKKGEGTLYYTALLRRAPIEMPTTPLDRGFVVQRFFEPVDNATKHGRVFYAGDLVRVRVRVATRDARTNVAIDVPLPAGLEAVDTSLSTTARGAGNLDDTARSDGDDGDDSDGLADGEGGPGDDEAAIGFFWSPFVHTEKRDDRVSFYADELPPGVHTLSFVARATTIGTFALLPAEATEMYAPEVFGRSDGGELTVVPVITR